MCLRKIIFNRYCGHITFENQESCAYAPDSIAYHSKECDESYAIQPELHEGGCPICSSNGCLKVTFLIREASSVGGAPAVEKVAEVPEPEHYRNWAEEGWRDDVDILKVLRGGMPEEGASWRDVEEYYMCIQRSRNFGEMAHEFKNCFTEGRSLQLPEGFGMVDEVFKLAGTMAQEVTASEGDHGSP